MSNYVGSISMPYNVPISKFGTQLESDGINYKEMLCDGVGKNLDTILLVLSSGVIEVIKHTSDIISSLDMFSIIDASGEDSIYEINDNDFEDKNAIISLIPTFNWDIGLDDMLYEPRAYDWYMSVYRRGLSSTEVFFMAISLSYRFGVKFSFMKEDESGERYILTFDKAFPKKLDILNELEFYKKDIESTFNVETRLVRRVRTQRVYTDDWDDIDKEA